MSDSVADLLASIDDVLETAAAPVPVPAPAGPVEPVETAQASPVVEVPAAPAPAPEPRAVEVAAVPPVAGAQVSAVPRLPYWWQADQQHKDQQRTGSRRAERAGTAEPQQPQQPQACEHARLVVLMEEKGGEALARLCLDCDERLPATDPEPDPECEHEQRLEARSESGKLVGYVCAVGRCGARLTVEEVHGRAGKWLRPAASYYPRPRIPLSPAPVAEGDEAPKPALSPGTRRLLVNAGAAGAGYGLGLVPLLGGWIDECGRMTSISGALVLGGGICLVVAHVWDRRTRHWHPALELVARIPLMSAITALALYAPASQI
ncbi:hypothetical protein OG892_39735 [Streptomyces sp. NBC_00341]|uniref:hypothetical protein n=1 Tax=Streptomyces sp. NBC_00341 TaxID=2975717 RepID=UPI00308CD5E9|nr:hypothetical protein OG892_39735 [Streptomyces sp. NBC_00341]